MVLAWGLAWLVGVGGRTDVRGGVVVTVMRGTTISLSLSLEEAAAPAGSVARLTSDGGGTICMPFGLVLPSLPRDERVRSSGGATRVFLSSARERVGVDASAYVGVDASPQNECARLGTGRRTGVPSAEGGQRYCGDGLGRPLGPGPVASDVDVEPGVMGDGYGAGRLGLRAMGTDEEGEGERDRELGAERRVGVR